MKPLLQSQNQISRKCSEAKKHRIHVFHIGEILTGRGNVLYEKEGTHELIRDKGFVHFAK